MNFRKQSYNNKNSFFLGFAERVRHGLERVQASEEEEGPQRAQAAVVGLLPLLPGKRKTTDHLFKFIQLKRENQRNHFISSL